jgi:hypothetical protein
MFYCVGVRGAWAAYFSHGESASAQGFTPQPSTRVPYFNSGRFLNLSSAQLRMCAMLKG